LHFEYVLNFLNIKFVFKGTRGHGAVENCQKCQILGKSCAEWTAEFRALVKELREGRKSPEEVPRRFPRRAKPTENLKTSEPKEPLPIVPLNPSATATYPVGSDTKYYADLRPYKKRVSTDAENYPDHVRYVGFVNRLKIDWVRLPSLTRTRSSFKVMFDAYFFVCFPGPSNCCRVDAHWRQWCMPNDHLSVLPRGVQRQGEVEVRHTEATDGNVSTSEDWVESFGVVLHEHGENSQVSRIRCHHEGLRMPNQRRRNFACVCINDQVVQGWTVLQEGHPRQPHVLCDRNKVACKLLNEANSRSVYSKMNFLLL
jgi:hypothetical protein